MRRFLISKPMKSLVSCRRFAAQVGLYPGCLRQAWSVGTLHQGTRSFLSTGISGAPHSPVCKTSSLNQQRKRNCIKMGMKKKLIIDVDTGIDDAQAIMMALSVPDVEVVGITCVAGNVNVNKVCSNTLKVLQAWDRLDVPVYKGAEHAMVGPDFDDSEYPGYDGLGEREDLKEPDMSLIQKEHAVDFLRRIVHENPGEITLVALAPLTNIALTLCMDPSWGTKLKHAVIMGGSITGRAEFNFKSDCEAASVVLTHLKMAPQVLSKEVCLQTSSSWEWFDQLMSVATLKGNFHRAINENLTKCKKENQKTGYYSCDPAAMFVALDDTAVKDSVKKHCFMELAGSLTRGQMIVDWNGSTQNQPNVEIVKSVDIKLLEKYYEAMLQ